MGASIFKMMDGSRETLRDYVADAELFKDHAGAGPRWHCRQPMVGVRMSDDMQDQIRAWASLQDDNPPLATAIRRLVAIALLKAKTAAR